MLQTMWLQIISILGCQHFLWINKISTQTVAPSSDAGLICSCPHQSWNTAKLLNMVAGAIGIITLALAWTPKHRCINYYRQETEGWKGIFSQKNEVEERGRAF